MFRVACKYNAEREDNVIYIRDLGGLKSLTNDMENVLLELYQEHSDINNCIIIYKDSMGIWDRVLIRNLSESNIDIDFIPLCPGKVVKLMTEAITIAKTLTLDGHSGKE